MRDESVARGQPHATREIVALILYTTTRMRKLLLECSMICVMCSVKKKRKLLLERSMICVMCSVKKKKKAALRAFYDIYVICAMFYVYSPCRIQHGTAKGF